MKVLVLLALVAAVAVAGFIGYRATQPKRHCRVEPGTWVPGSDGYPGHEEFGGTVCWKG